MGAVPACLAKHASERKRCAPAVRPMITAAVTVPMLRCSSSCGACAVMRSVSSEKSASCSLVISLMRRSCALATRSCGLAGSWAELTRQASADARAFERGRSELRLDLGGDADQMPAQAADQPVTFVHQLVSVIAQHPDLVGLLVKERHRQGLDAFADRCHGDRSGVDRVRLPRCA
jgi:hypothetical protein